MSKRSRPFGKIIAVANQKGGVGKTTTAVNLATSLAAAEFRTLLLDMDPQGNATSGMGVDKETIEGGIYDVLIGKMTLQDVFMPTELGTLTLVPANIDLIGAEVELHQYPSGQKEHLLRHHLSAIEDPFDFIIIDCPPSLGILTLNALTAAKSVLIPIQCEYYAMEGVSLLLKTIDLVRQGLNPDLQREGILLTMHDARTNLSSQVAYEVKQYFKDEVYKTVISRNVTLSEAPSHGRPVLLYDVKSRGALSYLDLAKEVIKNAQKSSR